VVFSFSPAEVARGVCTHSFGNHAQAVALAARRRGADAFIVMPRNAAQVKKAAVADYDPYAVSFNGLCTSW
jgi:threonine dehydratase